MTRCAGPILLLLLVALAVSEAAAAASAAEPTSRRRVILLGFDGLDPGLIERFGAEELPNLTRLIAESGGGELTTTTPASSPVSWSSIITGLDPDGTGIHDFLTHDRRDADGTVPEDFVVKPRYALFEVGSAPPIPVWARLGIVVGLALVAGLLVALILRLLRLRSRKALLVVVLLVAAGGAAGLYWFSFRWLPAELPAMTATRMGEPFWERAARVKGARVRALTVPMTFPASCACTGDVRILAGLGVPDVRGTSGTYHVWTTRVLQEERREFGGVVRPFPTEWDVIVRGKLRVSGPVDPMSPDGNRLETSIHYATLDDAPGPGMVWSLTREGATQGWSLESGQRLSPVEFQFGVSPLIEIVGLGHLRLLEDEGHTTFYLSPMSFHPAHVPPTLPISYPQGYVAELADAVGPFSTLGWAVDTWAHADGFLDEAAFREELAYSFEQRRKLFRHHLEHADDWEVLAAVFEVTDRAQHMLWRQLAAGDEEGIREVYGWADEVTGEVLEQFGDDHDTLVLVLSDHGFAAFERGVNLNTWLYEQGYLALREETPRAPPRVLADLFESDDFFTEVDWSRTRAFAMGLGSIYLNVTGLDPDGVVLPTKREALAREIAARLAELEDSQHPGVKVVESVAWKRASAGAAPEAYELADLGTGERLSGWGREHPELVVGFRPGYRVSWQTTLGGIPGEVFEDNQSAWSGDHCSLAPHRVPGVVAANRPLRALPRHVRDVAPTMLDWLGVPAGELPGKSLLD